MRIMPHRSRARSVRLRRGVAAAFVVAGGIAAMSAAATRAQAASHIPDFNGVWAKYAYNYPKPYMSGGKITDGYDNPYLRPWVVALLQRDDAVTASGHLYPTPHSICYPEGVPYVFGETQMQILQTPAEVTMIFGGEQEQARTISLNRPHSAHVASSWYGESVGHFEGDTLVVGTIGLAANPQVGSMGFFGTPHTDALHLIERYRFLADGEKSVAASLDRSRFQNPPFEIKDVIAGGKTLRLTFTMDDPSAYRKPWSVTVDFLPLRSHIEEYVCAENYQEKELLPFVPKADVPDF
jgi:hypothetical protein